MGRIESLGDFCSRHWGDVVGLLLLLMGVMLEVFHAFAILKWQAQLSGIHELSNGLVLAAMGILKLRPMPKNGNGDAPKSN